MHIPVAIIICILFCIGLFLYRNQQPKNKPKEIQIGKLYYLNNYGDPFKERITVIPVEIKNGFVKIQRISSGSFKFSNDVFDSMPCDVFLMVHKLDLDKTETVK